MVLEIIILAIVVFLFEFDKDGKQWRSKEYQDLRKIRAQISGDDHCTPKQLKERMRKRYGYAYDEWCREYDYKIRKYKVELIDAGPDKRKAIQTIVQIPDLGLKQAMDIVNGIPSILSVTDTKEEAEHYKMMVERIGAKVIIRDENEKIII